MSPALASSRSVPHVESGRFVLGDAIEHRCQVVSVAESGVTLRAAVSVAVGERIVAYLDRHGRVTGRVSATAGDVFTLHSTNRRAPAMNRLEASNAGRSGEPGQREERIVPLQTRVLLRLPAGRRLAGQIVDLSRTGVALTCPEALADGTILLVGARQATVMRRVHRLHGLAFTEPLAAADFGPDIVL